MALIQTQGTWATGVQPQSCQPWAGRLGHDFIQWNNIKMIFFFVWFSTSILQTSCWCTWYWSRTSNGRNVLPTCLIGFNRGVLGTDSDTHGTPGPKALALFNTSDKPWETEDVRRVLKIHLLHYWVQVTVFVQNTISGCIDRQDHLSFIYLVASQGFMQCVVCKLVRAN